MPRNKKRWINKKNTVTYELSLRSDKGEAVSVLTPIKAYGHQIVSEEQYDELASRFEDKPQSSTEEGDDGQYDDVDSDEDPFVRFTKPIGVVPGAVFITPEGEVINATEVPSWKPDEPAGPASLLKQVKAKYEAKPTEELEDIDPEILEALDNADQQDFEGFEDDFVHDLMKGEDGEVHFEEAGGGYGLDDLEGDDDVQGKDKERVPKRTYDSEEYKYDSDDYDSDESYEIEESQPRTNKLVDDMFDAALDRFDDDNTLDVDPDGPYRDPMIMGPSKAADFDHIFDEFLHSNSKVYVGELDEIFNKKKIAGFGGKYPPEQEKVPELEPIDKEIFAKKLAVDNGNEDTESEGEESDSLEDWRAGLTENLVLKEKEGGWDCESIISTYSNTENHPSLIAMPRNEDKIRLGARGAPKLVAANPEPERPKNKTLPVERKKDETPEEKRARKHAVKESRRKQREEKKNSRMAFKEEEVKQRKLNATNFTRGKTVVQYTL